jgi:AmpD protein
MTGSSGTSRHTPLFKDGWYQFSGRFASPNFGPRPHGTRISLVVVHSISLPPGRYGGDEVQQLFTNQLDWDAHPYFKSMEGLKVSAHFYIRRLGELQQFVSCNDRAWHAGASHHMGRSNCNDFSIGIELEGLEGEAFETAQYETLESLCAALLQHYPIAHIAGHEHIAHGRKHDPGAGFNWQGLQKSLGLPNKYFSKMVIAKSSMKNKYF